MIGPEPSLHMRRHFQIKQKKFYFFYEIKGKKKHKQLLRAPDDQKKMEKFNLKSLALAHHTSPKNSCKSRILTLTPKKWLENGIEIEGSQDLDERNYIEVSTFNRSSGKTQEREEAKVLKTIQQFKTHSSLSLCFFNFSCFRFFFSFFCL